MISMQQLYVVTDQRGLFVNKQKEWVDASEAKTLFRTLHKDEAINLVFELSSKDISLRAEALLVDQDQSKQPIVIAKAALVDDIFDVDSTVETVIEINR
jgi:hypothetical protein